MTVYAAQFTFHFGHTSSKKNISCFGKTTYEISEIKHIKSKSKTYPLIQSRCIRGLTNPTQHVKKHMSFWNKKHNHFQNSKHMPAYTISCIRRLTNWTPNTRVYTVVYAAYNQTSLRPGLRHGSLAKLAPLPSALAFSLLGAPPPNPWLIHCTIFIFLLKINLYVEI